MNHIALKGNLGKEPKIVELQGGKKLVSFSFCFNGLVKAGETEAIWFECVGYERIVDQVQRLGLGKGSRVIVSGRLGVNKYTNKDGNAVSSPKITLDAIESVLKLEAQETEAPQQTMYTSTSSVGVPNLDDIPF